ncbi:MAG: aspartate/glutamate racemase family protein [Dehalococcoidales bacterium]|jgi:Asp/Glu/hydantoin racemase|nr:aspartate/glutamate racemase family protein [Dehalococcoidales bacterium]
MKIWWQSAMDLYINPAWKDYTENLKTLLGEIVRSDTKITVHGTEAFSPLIEKSRYVELLIQPQIVKAAIRAQDEGYDAFCLGCTTDAGYHETREAVDIIVCYLSEVSMHLASILGHRFALLHYSNLLSQPIADLAQRYGLKDNFVPSRSFDIKLTDLQRGFDNPQIILDAATKVAEEAAQNGAGMLITGCGVMNMILRKHGITEIGGVPVLEGNGALVKTAELLMDLKKLGIKRSKLAFPPLTKAELAEIKKTFSNISLA